MIPGPDFYYKCPQCKNLIVRGSLISTDTKGARLYSDCKTIAPGSPDYPVITKCRKCNSIFWLFKLEDADFTPEHVKKNADVAEFLSIDEYFLALSKGLAENTEEEIYIRQRILWAFNDRYRDGNEAQESEIDERFNENIAAFMKLLNPAKPDDVLLLAEIYRVQGKFDECMNLLSSSVNSDDAWVLDSFNKQCAIKNTRVFEITE